MIEGIAFAGALADAGKYGKSAVLLGDVVDELQHVHGLAHARTAEQSHLAALGEAHQQVDDLDARDQKILAARLLIVSRRRPVNRQVFSRLHRAPLILRLAQNVHDAPERARAHRHGDPFAGARHGETAAQSLGWAHCNRAHHAVSELLLHLESQIDFVELERVIHLGNLIARKFHVDDRPDDLHDFTAGHDN